MEPTPKSKKKKEAEIHTIPHADTQGIQIPNSNLLRTETMIAESATREPKSMVKLTRGDKIVTGNLGT
jgi:hypothetical protein